MDLSKFIFAVVISSPAASAADNFPCEKAREIREKVRSDIERALSSRFDALSTGKQDLESKYNQIIAAGSKDGKAPDRFREYLQASLSSRLAERDIKNAGGQICISYFQSFARTVGAQLARIYEMTDTKVFSSKDLIDLKIAKEILKKKSLEPTPGGCNPTLLEYVSQANTAVSNFSDDISLGGKTYESSLNQMIKCLSSVRALPGQPDNSGASSSRT